MLAAAEDAVEDESVGLDEEVEVVPLAVVVDGAVEVAVAGEAVVAPVGKDGYEISNQVKHYGLSRNRSYSL